MKSICTNYTFAKGLANVGSVTLNGVNVPLSSVLCITNATRATILYIAQGVAAYSYAQGANSTLVLSVDTSSHSNTDSIQIWYEDGVLEASNTTLSSIQTQITTIISDLGSLATAANQTAGLTGVSTIITDLGTIITDLGLLATSAKQDTGNTTLSTISTNLSSIQTAIGTLSTAAKQDTGNTALANISTNLSAVQTAIANLATSAKQDTGNTALSGLQTTLTAIGAGIPTALGPTTMSGAMPVTLASDQTDVPTKITKINGVVPAMGTPTGDGDAGDNSLSTEAYTKAYNPRTNTWDMVRILPGSTPADITDKAIITTLSPASEDPLLQALLMTLQAINDKLGMPNASGQFRASLDAASAGALLSANITQVNSGTAATGEGVSTTNTLRVVQSWEQALPTMNPPLTNIYNSIVSS